MEGLALVAVVVDTEEEQEVKAMRQVFYESVFPSKGWRSLLAHHALWVTK